MLLNKETQTKPKQKQKRKSPPVPHSHLLDSIISVYSRVDTACAGLFMPENFLQNWEKLPLSRQEVL